jgi:hypothetical protein
MTYDKNIISFESFLLNSVLRELDEFIALEVAVDIFQLPLDAPSGNSCMIKPIYCTYIDPHAVYILEISSISGSIQYVSLSTSDGGVLLYRTDPTPDLNTLMVNCDEGWTKF